MTTWGSSQMCAECIPHAQPDPFNPATLELDLISWMKTVSLKASAPSNSHRCHVTHSVRPVDTISSHLEEAFNVTLTQPPAISDCSEMVDLVFFKPMFVSKWERHKNAKDKD